MAPLLQHLEFDLGNAAVEHAQLFSGAMAQIDHALADIGTAVINPHYSAAAVPKVVTRTRVPKGRVRWAAVIVPGR